MMHGKVAARLMDTGDVPDDLSCHVLPSDAALWWHMSASGGCLLSGPHPQPTVINRPGTGHWSRYMSEGI